MSEKPKLHVVSFSGGKDSTAMLLRMVEEGYPIDIILYCDTGLEFPEMEDHIRKVEDYIGRKITVIKAEKDFMYWASEHENLIKSEKSTTLVKGEIKKGYGWSTAFSRWCTKELKTNVINKYLRDLKEDYELIQYAGIAYDEPERERDLTYPLIEWKMTEADCLEYCYARGFDWGGLYELFDRVSCWCCPLQSLKALRTLKNNRPELWAKLLEMDKIINEVPRDKRNNFQFTKSLTDIERRFKVEDEFLAQGKKLRTKEFFQALKDRGINY